MAAAIANRVGSGCGLRRLRTTATGYVGCICSGTGLQRGRAPLPVVCNAGIDERFGCRSLRLQLQNARRQRHAGVVDKSVLLKRSYEVTVAAALPASRCRRQGFRRSPWLRGFARQERQRNGSGQTRSGNTSRGHGWHRLIQAWRRRGGNKWNYSVIAARLGARGIPQLLAMALDGVVRRRACRGAAARGRSVSPFGSVCGF